jgi:hypothetical protein
MDPYFQPPLANEKTDPLNNFLESENAILYLKIYTIVVKYKECKFELYFFYKRCSIIKFYFVWCYLYRKTKCKILLQKAKTLYFQSVLASAYFNRQV